MVSILKSWFHEHIISSDEYRRMNTILAEKYGLNSCSIFLDSSAVQR
ncbi:MAG: SHOCT domain-containing protein [Lachnospiraceae bacterium]